MSRRGRRGEIGAEIGTGGETAGIGAGAGTGSETKIGGGTETGTREERATAAVSRRKGEGEEEGMSRGRWLEEDGPGDCKYYFNFYVVHFGL